MSFLSRREKIGQGRKEKMAGAAERAHRTRFDSPPYSSNSPPSWRFCQNMAIRAGKRAIMTLQSGKTEVSKGVAMGVAVTVTVVKAWISQITQLNITSIRKDRKGTSLRCNKGSFRRLRRRCMRRRRIRGHLMVGACLVIIVWELMIRWPISATSTTPPMERILRLKNSLIAACRNTKEIPINS